MGRCERLRLRRGAEWRGSEGRWLLRTARPPSHTLSISLHTACVRTYAIFSAPGPSRNPATNTPEPQQPPPSDSQAPIRDPNLSSRPSPFQRDDVPAPDSDADMTTRPTPRSILPSREREVEARPVPEVRRVGFAPAHTVAHPLNHMHMQRTPLRPGAPTTATIWQFKRAPSPFQRNDIDIAPLHPVGVTWT